MLDKMLDQRKANKTKESSSARMAWITPTYAIEDCHSASRFRGMSTFLQHSILLVKKYSSALLVEETNSLYHNLFVQSFADQ